MKLEANKEFMENLPSRTKRARDKNSFDFVTDNRTMNFDVTLICHKLLANFVSVRHIFMAQST